MLKTKGFGEKNFGEKTSDSLESAADSVRAVGTEGADAITGLANDAAKKLDTTATYVREISQTDMLAGLRSQVRKTPVRSLAVAAAVGLVAGFSYRMSARMKQAPAK